jgi:hypothetical protein
MDDDFQANMVSKKRPTTYTLSARDPIPVPPGHVAKHELRAPPKAHFPYRDSNGVPPATIHRMLERKRQYEEECEEAETQRDIAAFEAKHGGKRREVPALPIPPKVDWDVLRTFEPPSATRFYEYQGPSIAPVAIRTAKAPRAATREMARGCPACNPEHHDAIRPRTRSPTRNGCALHHSRAARRTPTRDELPLQLNQAYWHVLDEPAVPARPAVAFDEVPKPKPFRKTRTGPTPGGIPICKNDVIESRAQRQAWFEDQMARRDDRELGVREKTLQRRAMTSRAFHAMLSDHAREIAEQCGQEWASIPSKRAATARARTKLQEEKRLAIKPDEERMMAELKEYDDAMWEEYQAIRKKPTQAIVEVLHQKLARHNCMAMEEG